MSGRFPAVESSRRPLSIAVVRPENVAPGGISSQQALRQQPGAWAKMAGRTFLENAEPYS